MLHEDVLHALDEILGDEQFNPVVNIYSQKLLKVFCELAELKRISFLIFRYSYLHSVYISRVLLFVQVMGFLAQPHGLCTVATCI